MTTQVKQIDLFNFGINGNIPSVAVNILNPEAPGLVTPAPTTFFCRGHLTDMAIERQSENQDFCRYCWAIVKAERTRERDADRWEGDIFIHHNKRFVVAKLPKSKETLLELKTICLGAVKTQETAEKQHRVVKDCVTTTPTTQNIGLVSTRVSVTTENCLFCGKELTKQRRSKLFCNATCRVRHNRFKKVTA